MSLQPFKILKEAIRAVPAVKYALGVAGIVSVVAIVGVFGLSPQWAIIGTVVTMVLMVALLVFAKLTTTAKKHFLLPVMVLMWSFLALTIATACLLFSTVFFKWPMPPTDLFGPGTNKVTVTTQPIGDLLRAAKMQRESGDYEGGWKSLQEALSLQPNSDEARQEQIQLAMTWLRNLHVREPNTYTKATDQLLPCLSQGAVQAKGTLAGDIYAHIGWAYFLKFRDGIRELDIAGQYRKALTYDADNPYAHVMWGHWIIVDDEELSEAKKHFAAALKTGREKKYVRELQLAALEWYESDDNKIELIHAANEMRKNGETLPLEMRSGVMSKIYWAADSKFSRRLRSSLPPAEHLATFLWLTEGIKVEESSYQTFALAQITEDSGDYTRALTLYLSLLSRPASYEKEIKEGIARCKQHVAHAR